MKKLVLLVILLFLPAGLSWKWNTHESIAEKVFYSLPLELQSELNITSFKEGSIAPDKVFHDNVWHHYPPSFNLSKKWLNLSLVYYENKDFNSLSFSLGVISHYISDSFASPHYISKETEHDEFEGQVKNYIPKTRCIRKDYNLSKGLYLGSLNEKDWWVWLDNRDKSIPEKEVDDATELFYSVVLNFFNVSCNEPTKIEKIGIRMNLKLLLEGIVFVLIIGWLLFAVIKDVRSS